MIITGIETITLKHSTQIDGQTGFEIQKTKHNKNHGFFGFFWFGFYFKIKTKKTKHIRHHHQRACSVKAAETWSKSPLKTFFKASRNRRALAAPHEVEQKKDFAKPCLLNDTNSACHGFF
jgi:hypothetical protein